MSSTPLHDLALLSDGRGAALVSRAGSIEWCCLPRFDSGSCFAALLDEEHGGRCTVELDGEAPQPSDANYLPGTLVHAAVLRGPRGTVEVADALVPGVEPQRLARVIRCTDGEAEVTVRIDPRFDYGEARPWVRELGRHAAWLLGGDDALAISSTHDVQRAGDHGVNVRATLAEGEHLELTIAALEPRDAEQEARRLTCSAADDLEVAADHVRGWLEGADKAALTDEAVARSVLTLCAMVYEPTGAIVAAPTTSLPETPTGERTWDYRYAWLRDATWTSRVLAQVGLTEVGHRFCEFALRSTAGHPEDMQVLYGVGGERRIGNQKIELAGWRGAQPVRIGNGATGQVQRDEAGEILQQCLDRHRRGYDFDADEWRLLRRLADHVTDTWTEPGHGFWELPTSGRCFIYSAAASYAAVRAATEIAESRGDTDGCERWEAAAPDMQERILGPGYDDRRGCFLQAFGYDDLDATALLLPHTGVVAWDDPRMVSTADVIADALGEDGLVRRYDTDDGLPGREGTFLACAFWLAECLARQQREGEAAAVYERAMQTASPLGLFTEEYDPGGAGPLGNYPQALTHLAQVAAAVALRACGAPATVGGRR